MNMISVILAGGLFLAALHAEVPNVECAIKSVHERVRADFTGPHGLLLDFSGEIPTPDDCRRGFPNSMSWLTPIANSTKFTGLYLPAMCERAKRSGRKEDREYAGKLANALMLCASVSEVKGFIARAVCSDGRSHYPLGSEDQTLPWFYGLFCYLQSDIPTPEERAEIKAKYIEVSLALEANGWQCPCDGPFKGQVRGSLRGFKFFTAPSLLFVTRTAYELTKEETWLKKYHSALQLRSRSAVKKGLPAPSLLEICSGGYAQDEGWLKSIDRNYLWIYVKNVAVLRILADLETDPHVKAAYRKGLAECADRASKILADSGQFENRDTGPLPSASWRKLFTGTWEVQNDQKICARISGEQYRITNTDKRKKHEHRYMTIPLSAAAICAYSGEARFIPAILETIVRYDYATVHRGEMFLAEAAYYAIAQEKESGIPRNRD